MRSTAPDGMLLVLTAFDAPRLNDEGIVITVRPHGETAAVVELFTRQHGRHAGLVYGGRSRRLRPVLQTGNHVDAVWKARLAPVSYCRIAVW